MTVTLYRVVADGLRQKISETKPSHNLPSELDLTREFKVSRQTVRTALKSLADEGLIYPVQGCGWVVRDHQRLPWVASEPERNTRIDQTPADAWSNGIRNQGHTPHASIRVENILADERIRDLMGLAHREAVVVRRRLRYADHQLQASADTYFPRALVSGTAIELPDDVLPGTYAILEQLGHGWRTRTDSMVSRPPTTREIDLFGLAPGVSVMEHVRVRRSAEGRVVAVTISVLPGDRNIIVYEGTV